MEEVISKFDTSNLKKLLPKGKARAMAIAEVMAETGHCRDYIYRNLRGVAFNQAVIKALLDKALAYKELQAKLDALVS